MILTLNLKNITTAKNILRVIFSAIECYSFCFAFLFFNQGDIEQMKCIFLHTTCLPSSIFLLSKFYFDSFASSFLTNEIPPLYSFSIILTKHTRLSAFYKNIHGKFQIRSQMLFHAFFLDM